MKQPDASTLEAPTDGAALPPPASLTGDIQKLLETNIAWSEKIFQQNKKITHRLTMMVVGNYVRLALVLLPIILGIIYLPPLLTSAWEQYNALFQNSSTSGVEPLKELFDILQGN